MDPPPPLECSAPGCQYSTPPGIPDFNQSIQLMAIHTTQAHPGPGQQQRPTTKVDKRPRPEVTQDMSEHDWRFFVSEWEDYKRATGITDQALLDELWSCMAPDLKRLAFDQGGKEALATEELMLARIRLLAVSVLHAAVHTVSLHEARQGADESTKAFAARGRGIAANCDLSKDCTCGVKVSFLEETVYHVVMAGLRDREMQERCLAAAILKTIKDISSLVEFCSAEESGRMSAPTVGAMRSSYQRGKANKGQQSSQQTQCGFCGGGQHSSSSREVREKECRAFNQVCRTCSKVGHLSTCCRSGTKTAASTKPSQQRRVKNAAVEDKQTEEGLCQM